MLQTHIGMKENNITSTTSNKEGELSDSCMRDWISELLSIPLKISLRRRPEQKLQWKQNKAGEGKIVDHDINGLRNFVRSLERKKEDEKIKGQGIKKLVEENESW